MSTDITRLVDFILDRITEEEAAIATAHLTPRRRTSDAHAFANCQARRAIVTICAAEEGSIHCRVILALLALPYADHSDYVDLWGSGLDLVPQRA